MSNPLHLTTYPVWLPGELIQIKMVVDLPDLNRGKQTFQRRNLR
jgi:hypothetical protein